MDDLGENDEAEEASVLCFHGLSVPSPTRTHYFVGSEYETIYRRVPITSIYGTIFGTYKIVGSGWLR